MGSVDVGWDWSDWGNMFRVIAVILHGPLLVSKGPSGRGCEGLLACLSNMHVEHGAVVWGGQQWEMEPVDPGGTKDRNLAVELMRS